MRNIDWEAIEAAYRAGVLSVSAISQKYEVSRAGIEKRAARHGWTRDLSARVKARTAEKLVRTSVAVAVSGGTESRILSDEQVVDAAAEEGALVVRTHRRDIGALKEVVLVLGSQLRDAAIYRDRLKEMILASVDPKSPTATAALMKAIKLPSHAAVARDLAQALQRLISLERQAFSIGQSEDAAGIEAWLKRLESE